MNTLRGIGFVMLGAVTWTVVGFVAGAMAGAITGYYHGVHDSAALGEYAARRAPEASALLAIVGSFVGIVMWAADRKSAPGGRLRPFQRLIVGMFAGALSGLIAARFLSLHLRPLAAAVVGACIVGGYASAWAASELFRSPVGASIGRTNPPVEPCDGRESRNR